MITPKGYATQAGYHGLVNGRWMMFSTEEEYLEYVKESDSGNAFEGMCPVR